MERLSRRELLLGGGAVALGTYAAYKILSRSPEDREVLSNLDGFEKEILGYMALFELERDEILFVDEDNVPVGPPVKFRDFIDKKTKADGEVIERYLYTPGETDESGVLKGDLPGEWLDYLQEKVQRDFPGHRIASRHNIVKDFQLALQNDEEPDLVEKVKEGEVKEYIDIVKHFSDKPVIGAEQYSRYDYVQEQMVFESEKGGDTVKMSEVLQTELRRLMPGVCAQESKFDNGLESKTGAKGIFQFMPKTWEHYGGTDEDFFSLRRQVEIAGQFFNDLYIEVKHHIGDENISKISGLYVDEESYEVNFIAPLIVSAYNAGSKRVGKAVGLYLEKNQVPLSAQGKELFFEVITHAHDSDNGNTEEEKLLDDYRGESRQYAPKVYAKAALLTEKYRK